MIIVNRYDYLKYKAQKLRNKIKKITDNANNKVAIIQNKKETQVNKLTKELKSIVAQKELEYQYIKNDGKQEPTTKINPAVRKEIMQAKNENKN